MPRDTIFSTPSSSTATFRDESQVLLNRLARLPVSIEELGIASELAHYQDSVERGVPDPYLREILKSVVNEIEAAVVAGGFVTPPRDADLGQGAVHILNTSSNQPVRVDFGSGANCVHHLCLFGVSGAGKSSLQAQIATQAARSCRTFILDVNRFFRRIPAMFVHHQLVRWEHLRLNLFDAPNGIPLNQYDQAIVAELCRAYGLQFAEYEITKAIREIREKETPNLVSLLTALEQTKVFGWAKRRHYIDSAILIISNLIHATGELFRCQQGMDLNQLLAGNIVLELDGLLVKHQAFLTRYFFEYLHLSSLSRGAT